MATVKNIQKVIMKLGGGPTNGLKSEVLLDSATLDFSEEQMNQGLTPHGMNLFKWV